VVKIPLVKAEKKRVTTSLKERTSLSMRPRKVLALSFTEHVSKMRTIEMLSPSSGDN
jgi:hypothetical protein